MPVDEQPNADDADEWRPSSRWPRQADSRRAATGEATAEAGAEAEVEAPAEPRRGRVTVRVRGRRPTRRDAADEARRARRAASRPRHRPKRPPLRPPRPSSDDGLRARYHDEVVPALPEGVRLRQPDAGAAPVQDRRQHRPRRGADQRQGARRRGRRPGPDHRPEADRDPRPALDRPVPRCARATRSAPRSRCAASACGTSWSG